MAFIPDAEKEKSSILIVDDLPENLLLLEKTLRKKGYIVAVASSGPAALKSLEKSKPDLILLDVLMPEMDGFEFCGIIKNDENNKDIPVIFLTAVTGREFVLKAFEYGAADYISKPFNMLEAVARVKMHIELKKSHDKNLEYINKLHEANKKLSKKESELDELNASKDKFFSIIAHDLKNPFQGFLGLTGLLLDEFDSLEKTDIRQVIKELHKSSERLFKLLENLLTWSRIQKGRMVFSPDHYNLFSVTSDNIRIFEDLAIEKNLHVFNLVDTECSAYFDRLMIDTVLRNLISNAIKFSHTGGEIRIRSDNGGEYTSISIEDIGIGMSAYEIEQLFRIDTLIIRNGTANEHGTGLGLVLCKELIEKNSGRINVESSPGSGSTFTFMLPKK